jgi:hypothetical protein
VQFVEVQIVPQDRLNNACGATFMNATMVQSLFFCNWGNGATGCCNFITEVVKNRWFCRGTWINFVD